MKLVIFWALIFPRSLAIIITQDTVVEVTQTVTGLTGLGPPLAFSAIASTTTSESSTLQTTTTQPKPEEASAVTASALAVAVTTTALSRVSTTSPTEPKSNTSSSLILSASVGASTSAPSEKKTSTKISIPTYGIVLISFGVLIAVISLLFVLWRHHHKLPRESRGRRTSVRSLPVSIIKKPLDAFDLTSFDGSMPASPDLHGNADTGHVPVTAARSSVDMFSRSALNREDHHVHFAEGGNGYGPSTSRPVEHDQEVFTAYNHSEIIAPKPTLPANAYQRPLTTSFDNPYGNDDPLPLDASRYAFSPSPLRFVSMNGTSTPRLSAEIRDHLTVPSTRYHGGGGGGGGGDGASTFYANEWEDIPVVDNNTITNTNNNNNDNFMLEPSTLRAYSPSNYSRHSGFEREGGAYDTGAYKLPTRPTRPSR